MYQASQDNQASYVESNARVINPDNDDNNQVVAYIGAFVDFLPLIFYENVDTYVYVDQLPDDHQGHFQPNQVGGQITKDMKTFLSYVCRGIQKVGWLLHNFEVIPETNLLIFDISYHGKKSTLHYFYNLSFPEEINPRLQSLLSKRVTSLYICGYSPEFSYYRGQLGWGDKNGIFTGFEKLKDIKISDGCMGDLDCDQLKDLSILEIDEENVIIPLEAIYKVTVDFDRLTPTVKHFYDQLPDDFSRPISIKIKV